MKLTYIITISPVIHPEYLNMIILSLNVQTNKNFNVIFYNQTLNKESLLKTLVHKPEFEYRWYNIEAEYFFGRYPIWDIYGFIQKTIDENLASDYLISLHMEEFLDANYNEEVLKVLQNNQFDLLLANLHWTNYTYDRVRSIELFSDRDSFNTFTKEYELDKCTKWGLSPRIFTLTKHPVNFYKNAVKTIKLRKELNWRKNIVPTSSGYTKLKSYLFEDVFWIKKDFAAKTGWFKSEVGLYFEDIHINFMLKNELQKITDFPVYFNKCKIYHLQHKKYYYQIQDETFTNEFLKYSTNVPTLVSLQKAISNYKAGIMDRRNALSYSKRNDKKTGAADINISRQLKIIDEFI